MPKREDFSASNESKADFSSIYVQPDPRSYFRILGGLGYAIPHLARPVFDQVIDACERAKGAPLTVLDLGCSYGINAILMKYALSYDQLVERYEALAQQALSPADLLNLDRHFLAAWPRKRDIRVIGLDVSAPAVTYAEASGALDVGIVADLENEAVPDQARTELAKVDLIVSTGCVGYVTSRSFEKLVDCTGSVPWVASFVLRMFDYGGIANTLGQHRLQTEKFEGTSFVQRRFRDEEEMQGTLAALAQRGVSPVGKEADGLFHAEFFCSRPPAICAAEPLQRLISVSSGVNRAYGRRPRLGQTSRQSKPALRAKAS